MKILEKLNWRYATKKFDPGKKLTEQQLNVLLESVNLAATSYGLQPFKVFVIENVEVRGRLGAAAYNQPQVTDASQVLVFAAKTDVSHQYIDDYTKLVSTRRGIALGELEDFKLMIQGTVSALDPASLKNWTSRQAYLALGFLLATAAVEGIDACPMEGFDRAKFDEILDLKQQGLSAVVMATVGFRSGGDKHAGLAKVRKGVTELVVRVK